MLPALSAPRAIIRPDDSLLRSDALDRLAGDSPELGDVKRRLAVIGRASGSVLVLGASGTGKELAARVIHDMSPRAGGPFVAVDCGALSEGVLESELFGHARGAFTGAAAERRGLFEAAHGGTIFLDEIANTTLQLQARLLRVLQEREVRRVGCNVSRRIDVRVIAATNRDLARDVRLGTFREDLLYRLDVLSVRMPSLRERIGDVAAIAEHVLHEISQETCRRMRLTIEALALLQAHDWPGNVRELRNVLEQAAAFAEDGVIRGAHLPDRIAGRVGAEPVHSSPRPLQAHLDSFERRLLAARLTANAWNRTRTAAELGITRRTLFAKMGKLGISAGDVGD